MQSWNWVDPPLKINFHGLVPLDSITTVIKCKKGPSVLWHFLIMHVSNNNCQHASAWFYTFVYPISITAILIIIQLPIFSPQILNTLSVRLNENCPEYYFFILRKIHNLFKNIYYHVLVCHINNYKTRWMINHNRKSHFHFLWCNFIYNHIVRKLDFFKSRVSS